MGANAATKLLKVVDNLYSVLGIEMINASQALALRGADIGHLQQQVDAFREVVPVIEDDRYLHPDLIAAANFLREQWVVSDDVLLRSN